MHWLCHRIVKAQQQQQEFVRTNENETNVRKAQLQRRPHNTKMQNHLATNQRAPRINARVIERPHQVLTLHEARVQKPHGAQAQVYQAAEAQADDTKVEALREVFREVFRAVLREVLCEVFREVLCDREVFLANAHSTLIRADRHPQSHRECTSHKTKRIQNHQCLVCASDWFHWLCKKKKKHFFVFFFVLFF